MLTSGGCYIQLWRLSGKPRATTNRRWQLARAFPELKTGPPAALAHDAALNWWAAPASVEQDDVPDSAPNAL